MSHRCACLSLMITLLAGCEGAIPIYRPTTGGYMGTDISEKSTWTARGSVSEPQAAIDGQLATAARGDHSAGASAGTSDLVIDLGRPCLFQTVILDHGHDEHGYCARVGVETSVDGKVFLRQHEAPGTRRATFLCLPGAVTARFIRLRALVPGNRPWTIAEVFVQ